MHYSLLLCFISSKPSDTTVLFIAADVRELGGLFRDLDVVREAGDAAKEASIQYSIGPRHWVFLLKVEKGALSIYCYCRTIRIMIFNGLCPGFTNNI